MTSEMNVLLVSSPANNVFWVTDGVSRRQEKLYVTLQIQGQQKRIKLIKVKSPYTLGKKVAYMWHHRTPTRLFIFETEDEYHCILEQKLSGFFFFAPPFIPCPSHPLKMIWHMKMWVHIQFLVYSFLVPRFDIVNSAELWRDVLLRVFRFNFDIWE